MTQKLGLNPLPPDVTKLRALIEDFAENMKKAPQYQWRKGGAGWELTVLGAIRQQ